VVRITDAEARGTDRYGKRVPRRSTRGYRGSADKQNGCCGKRGNAMLHIYLLQVQENREGRDPYTNV
jgi:hypothetical protein